MKLIILHYHFRPGGIRRVIELAAPHLVRESGGRISSVVLAGGEAPPPEWEGYFRQQLAPTPVQILVEPRFRYLSEQRREPARITAGLRRGLARLLDGIPPGEGLIWAHNLGIARNLLLTRELVAAGRARDLPLVAHHHDWWFDNRWLRWGEMKQFGFRTLNPVGDTIFASGPRLSHLTINHADAAQLQRRFSRQAGWLPNLAERFPSPPAERIAFARGWLQQRIGRRTAAPVWIIPCRLLRRKNVAEAVLLQRWLLPEAWLVTTGAITSPDEKPYARRLAHASERHGWNLRLSILAENSGENPSVPELLAVSDAVLLTSVQEGFGLPYLEAAAARRPLIARAIPNIAPDLERFGFRFPQLYQEIFIDPRLFDWRAEQQRQQQLFAAWRGQMPRVCQSWAGLPVLLAAKEPAPVPFSRLTLTAQLEVLAHPPAESWELCAPLNPHLPVWRKRARTGRLQVTRWPATAGDWLSGAAYGRRFWELIETANPPGKSAPPVRGRDVQADFIQEKLGAGNLYPLLWRRDS